MVCLISYNLILLHIQLNFLHNNLLRTLMAYLMDIHGNLDNFFYNIRHYI